MAMLHAFDEVESASWTEAAPPRALRAILADEKPRARTVTACAAIAVASHAAIGLAFNVWGVRDTGAIVTPTDAISVELVASDVVEQVAAPVSITSPAVASAVAPVEGAAAESIAAATAPAEPAPKSKEPEPTLEELVTLPTNEALQAPSLSTAPDTSEIPPADDAPSIEEPVAPQQKKKTDEAPAKSKRERIRSHETKPETITDEKKTKRAAKPGGAQSRGASNSKSAPARVSASAGDISGYAARVRARVAANRPSGRGMRGTAVVSFGVSKSGGLTYVRLARSSGNPGLDQAAISAVRRAAPFPQPPAGASTGQLRFSTPFYFR